MDLKEMQERFNEYYDFEKLKQYSLDSARRLIDDWENNYLAEFRNELEDSLTFKDLEIEYINTKLIINDNSRVYPFFRVCLQLINPKTKIAVYQYDIEYDIKGKLCDDYFFNV